MKKIFIIILILILVPLVPLDCFADDYEKIYDELGIKEIFEFDAEIFPELDFENIFNNLFNGNGVDIKLIFIEIFKYITTLFTSHYKVLMSIVILGFLVSITNILKSQDKAITETVFNISYVLYAIVIVYFFTNSLKSVKDLLDCLVLTIQSFIPVMLSLLGLSGGITSSSLISSSLLMMVEMLTHIINVVVLPLITSSVTISIANNMSNKINIGSMVSLMRQSAKWILGFCLAVYTGFYSVYGLVGSALDNRIGKAARYALGRGIPVVGGVVAETIETVMTTFGAVRNITGSAAVIFFCLYCIAPMIKTVIYLLIFKLAAIVLEPISDSRIIALTTETSEAISLVLSVLIAVFLLLVGAVGIILITGNFIN